MKRSNLLIAVSLALAAPGLAANPNGAQVVHGSASFSTPSANVLNVHNSHNAVINWQNFNIGAGQTTNFIQPSSASSVLNRVISNQPSAIFGNLNSNGRVFLINQNGLLIGQGAAINTAGFVGSTLNITDDDFLNGRLHFEGGGLGDLENHGYIHAGEDGSIVLIAPNIENGGVIEVEDGNVILAAGKSITISSLQNSAIEFEVSAADNQVMNLGQIIAHKGAASLFAKTLKHSGHIRANGLVRDADGTIRLVAAGDNVVTGELEAGTDEQGGRIEVLGDRVGLFEDAHIDASGTNGGGEVLIGGDAHGEGDVQTARHTRVSADAKIHADATANGDGGKVIVWADETTEFYGTATAQGGAQAGDGGFIEVSGKESLGFHGLVNASAPVGSAGSVLFDPRNITVTLAGTAAITDVDAFSDFIATDLTISAATITALTNQGTAVTLQASNDIIIDQAIITLTDGTGGDLTLQAGRSIILNNSINTSNGKLVLIANEFSIGDTQVINSDRQPGTAEINLIGGLVETGAGNLEIQIRAGNDKTNSDAGNVLLGFGTANDILITHNGQTAGGSVLGGDIVANSVLIDLDDLGGGVGGNRSIGSTDNGVLLNADFIAAHIHGPTTGGINLFARPNLSTTVTIGGTCYGDGGPGCTPHGVRGIETDIVSPANLDFTILDAGDLNIIEPVLISGDVTITTPNGAITIDAGVKNQDTFIRGNSVSLNSGLANVTLLGGTATTGNSNAFIQSQAGDINLTAANLVLTPGAGTDADAIIFAANGEGLFNISIGTCTAGCPALGFDVRGNGSSELGVVAQNFPFSMSWDGGAGTLNWTDALNWSTDNLPLGNADVTIDILAGSNIVNLAGGPQSVRSLALPGDEILDVAFSGILRFSGDITGTGDILNGGRIEAINEINTSIALFVDNSGVFHKLSGAGSVTFLSGISMNLDSELIVDASSVSMNGSTLLLSDGAALSGNGTLVGNVQVNGGLIDVIDNQGNPSTLTIDGSLLLDPRSTVVMELTGPVQGVDYSFLDVTGTVTLDGYLAVLWDNLFTSTNGASFDLIRAGGGFSGGFSNVVAPVGVTTSSINFGTPNVLQFVTDVVSPNIVFWTSPVSGNWDNPANWSTGLVPTATDYVQIETQNDTITVTLQDVRAASGLHVFSPLELVSSGQLNVSGDALIGGFLSMASTGGIAVGGDTVMVDDIGINNGALSVTGNSLLHPVAFLSLGNGGNLNITNGTLNVEGTLLSSLGNINLSNGVLNIPSLAIGAGGALTGVGTVNGNVLNVGGGIVPGGIGAIGILTINGNYLGATGGGVAIELQSNAGGSPQAGIDFDQLQITGQADFQGVLLISDIGGYVPVAGDAFPSIITYGSKTLNEFSQVTSTIAGFDGVATYNPTSLNLVLNTASLAITWDGGGGTDTSWLNPLNWSGDQLPGATSDVSISSASVLIDGIADALSLSLDADASLDIASTGVLTINGPSNIAGVLNLNGGTINNAQHLNIVNSFNVVGGTLAGDGVLLTTEGSSTTITATTNINGPGAGSQLDWVNQGLIEWQGGNIQLSNANIINQAEFYISGSPGSVLALTQGGGTFTNDVGAVLGVGAAAPASIGGRFENFGVIDLALPSDTLIITQGSLTLKHGALLMGQGQLTIGGGSGTLIVSDGGGISPGQNGIGLNPLILNANLEIGPGAVLLQDIGVGFDVEFGFFPITDLLQVNGTVTITGGDLYMLWDSSGVDVATAQSFLTSGGASLTMLSCIGVQCLTVDAQAGIGPDNLIIHEPINMGDVTPSKLTLLPGTSQDDLLLDFGNINTTNPSPVYEWDFAAQGGDLNWSNLNNWLVDGAPVTSLPIPVLPGVGDSVIIDSSGQTTLPIINVDVANANILNLQSDVQLNLTTGSLTIGGSGVIATTYIPQTGQGESSGLLFNGAAATLAGTATLTTLPGTYNDFLNGAPITIAQWDQAGLLSLEAATDLVFNTTAFNNLGAFEVEKTSTANVQVAGGAAFNNAGLILTDASVSMPVATHLASGLIHVQQGLFTSTSDFTAFGPISVDSGTAFSIGAGTTLTLGAPASGGFFSAFDPVLPPGELIIPVGATLNVDPSAPNFDEAMTLTLNGGTINQAENLTPPFNLDLLSGTINGTGSLATLTGGATTLAGSGQTLVLNVGLELNNFTTWQAGTISGTGPVTSTVGSTIALGAAGATTLDGVDWLNQGDFIWSSADDFIINGATFTNQAVSEVFFEVNTSSNNADIVGTGAFVNEGFFDIFGATATDLNIDVRFTNTSTGSVNVSLGGFNLVFGNDSNLDGNVFVNSGAVNLLAGTHQFNPGGLGLVFDADLNIGPGSTASFNGSVDMSLTGRTLSLLGGAITQAENLTPPSVLILRNGSISTSIGTMNSPVGTSVELAGVGNTLTVNGNLNLAGPITWSAGTISGAGSITSGTGVNLGASGATQLDGVNWTHGGTSFDWISANPFAIDNAVFTNNGTLFVATSANTADIIGSGSFVNAGSFSVAGGATATNLNIVVPFTNTSTGSLNIPINSFNLIFGNNTGLEGTVFAIAGSAVNLLSGVHQFNPNGGGLVFDAALNIGSGVTVNLVNLVNMASSPGALTLAGGTLNQAQFLIPPSQMNLLSGVFSANPASTLGFSADTTLAGQGNTLTLDAILGLSGPVTWNGGTINGTGELRLAGLNPLNLGQTGQVTTLDGFRLNSTVPSISFVNLVAQNGSTVSGSGSLLPSNLGVSNSSVSGFNSVIAGNLGVNGLGRFIGTQLAYNDALALPNATDELSLESSSLILDGTPMTGSGRLKVGTGSTLDVEFASSTSVNGRLVLDGGLIQLFENLEVAGAFDWTSGDILVGETNGSLITRGETRLTSGFLDADWLNGPTGRVTWGGDNSSDFVIGDATITNQGVFRINSFTNPGSGATLPRFAAAKSLIASGTGAFVNQGLLLIDAANGGQTADRVDFNLSFDNDGGSIGILSGSFSLGLDANEAPVTLVLDQTGESLQGFGTFIGNVDNQAGLVTPGIANLDNAGFTTGTLNILGNYRQGGQGTLAIKLDATQSGLLHDVLNVSGNVVADGRLRFDLINGSSAQATASLIGQDFRPFNFGTFAGRFEVTDPTGLNLNINSDGSINIGLDPNFVRTLDEEEKQRLLEFITRQLSDLSDSRDVRFKDIVLSARFVDKLKENLSTPDDDPRKRRFARLVCK